MNRRFTAKAAQELLRRYRLGHCTEDEVKIIERWYRSLDLQEDRERNLAAKDGLNALKVEMFNSISDKISLEEARGRTTGTQKPIRKLYAFDVRTLIRIAAILIVGTGLGLFFYAQNDFRNPDKQTLVVKGGKEEPSARISEAGLRSTIYLPDGSVVWLKPGGRLEYPATFTGHLREVSLTGEAFFDVAKDAERPFIIHAENFTTQVLGTTFNIKAYGNEDAAEVVVVTGKVMVTVKEASADKVKALVLHPKQKAIYSRKDGSLVEAPVTEQEVKINSNKNKLTFDETPLKDIINVLNATYDVDITLSNESMNDCMITADLTNEALPVSIAILSKAIHASYTIEGKNIILRGNGCGVQP
jgi:transmembrane sensor